MRKRGALEEFNDVYYYTRQRIDRCTSTVITLAILALLVVPTWVMYKVVSDFDDRPSGRGNSMCIGTLLVATLLFSAVLSLFTSARRHEILAAAAA